jgi:hypothetical protein
MGSPLATLVANFFLKHFKQLALNTVPQSHVTGIGYVGDNFAAWTHGMV